MKLLIGFSKTNSRLLRRVPPERRAAEMRSQTRDIMLNDNRPLSASPNVIFSKIKLKKKTPPIAAGITFDEIRQGKNDTNTTVNYYVVGNRNKLAIILLSNSLCVFSWTVQTSTRFEKGADLPLKTTDVPGDFQHLEADDIHSVSRKSRLKRNLQ